MPNYNFDNQYQLTIPSTIYPFGGNFQSDRFLNSLKLKRGQYEFEQNIRNTMSSMYPSFEFEQGVGSPKRPLLVGVESLGEEAPSGLSLSDLGQRGVEIKETPKLDLPSKKSTQITPESTFGGTTISSDWVYPAAAAGSAIGSMFVDQKSNTAYDSQQKIGNTLTQVLPGYWKLLGLGFNAASDIAENKGLNLNLMSKPTANEIGMSKWDRLLNNTAALLPFGGLAGKSVETANLSKDTVQASPSFTGAMKKISTAQELGGNTYLSGAPEEYTMNANKLNSKIGEQYNKSYVAKQSDVSGINSQNINKYLGINAKMGAKIPSKKEILDILSLYNKVKEEQEIESFQNGGTIGIDTNILPEGALHKNKNHLEEINEELDKVTEKGIPVIVTDENGDYKQVAEIEKEEIIFRKEITKKLEELWKKGDEESMIEAGKLLAEEIITNTQDNTNQLADIQDGEN